jgi:leucyl-tRNA synthetase
VPIIHCPGHGAVAVPDDQLPVELPKVQNYAPDGTNHSVLAGVTEWVNTTCPTCGGPAKRETDVLDGYVCSSWYLYRYTDAHNDIKAFDPEKVKYWMPVDFYFGGDHAVAHLMHIRFLQRAFIDGGILTMTEREPVKRLVYNGYINAEDGNKMSKSKGNTVDPMDIINSGYGADALRVFELFIAPYDQDTSWNTNGVPGAYRFLQRVWNVVQEYIESSNSDTNTLDPDLLKISHKTVKKVTSDLETLSFNTAVAAMMQLTNELHLLKAKEPITKSQAWSYAVESLIQMLAPFAPHIAEELWHDLGHEDSINKDHWPAYEDAYLVDDSVMYAVQVNGKLRGEVEVATDADQETVVAAARANKKVAGYVTSDPKKVIFIKGKLVSFVV